MINVVHFARRQRNDVADGCLLQCLQYSLPLFFSSYNPEKKPASLLADCDGKSAFSDPSHLLMTVKLLKACFNMNFRFIYVGYMHTVTPGRYPLYD